MFAIPGLIALLVFLYLRPQETFASLSGVTFPAVAAAVLIGVVLDWRLAQARPRWSLVFGLVTLLFVWSTISAVVSGTDNLGAVMAASGAAWLTFVFISQSAQSFRALEVLVVAVLVCSIIIAAVGLKQGFSPKVCLIRNGAGETGAGNVVIDGRPCQSARDCETENADPDADFMCEHTGPLGTSSISGRVRYRGVLEDPNELAWVLSLSVPLVFVLFERRRSFRRLLLAGGTTLAVMIVVVKTESRSGLLSLLTTLGVYFIRRFRWRGVAIGAILALPLLVLGGRSGADAESSSTERLECWQAGLGMWKGAPLFGVGFRNFTEHHFLTAHNSFVLTLAELGPVGLLLWTLIIYGSIKILARALRDFSDRPESQPAAQWAMALLAGMLGTLVSSFFLSIAYHGILWAFLGLVAAYWAAVRRHEPGWKVPFGLGDIVLMGLFDVGLMTSIAIYLRVRGI